MLWFLGALCAGLFLCLFIALYVIWSGQNRPGLVSDSVVETEISGALEAALAEIEDAKNAALDEIRHTLAQAPAAAAADNRVGAASALISGSSREARVNRVLELAQKGQTIPEISSAAGIAADEVRLILSLHQAAAK